MHDAIGLKERESRLLGVALNQMGSEQVLILRWQLLLSPLQAESHKPACWKQDHTCKCFCSWSALGEWELCPFQQTGTAVLGNIPTYTAPFLHLEPTLTLGADRGDREQTQRKGEEGSAGTPEQAQTSHGKATLSLSLEDESPGFLARGGYFFLCGHNG